MLQKIKKFLKKYGIFISIAFVILILFALILTILLQDKDTDEKGDDITDVTPIEDPLEFTTVRQFLGYHKNYEISFTSNVFNQIVQKEGNYPGFAVKEVSHFDWSENFVNQIGKGSLEYTTSASAEGGISHYWENDSEWVTYDESRDFLFMKFDTPIYIPGVTFNPRNESGLQEDLSTLATNYFSSDFEYSIDDVYISGNFYRVEYSRVLVDIPIYLELPREYLLLTPDGRLKGGMFLLAEFLEYTGMQYPLVSSENLRANISLREYPKNVEFKNLAPEIEEEFYTHGFAAFSNPFKQEGEIEINTMEIVYFYTGMSQEIVVPTFLFKGSGLLDVNGSLEEADFTVIANALDLEYVHIPPDSYFDVLESLE